MQSAQHTGVFLNSRTLLRIMSMQVPAGALPCAAADIMPCPADSFRVIPGRAEGASPESRNKLGVCLWIPGPALRAVPE
jgi:hypothetical protein